MCLAVGSVANALLPRTKGEGMGLLPIALAVGTGIGLPIGIFFHFHRERAAPARACAGACRPALHALVQERCVRLPLCAPQRCPCVAPCSPPTCAVQSCFFNPGILMAAAVRGGVPAGEFFALLAAQITGFFAGEPACYMLCCCLEAGGWDGMRTAAHPPPPTTIPCSSGAVVLWVFYLPHLNAAVQLPAADEVDRLLRDPAALE